MFFIFWKTMLSFPMVFWTGINPYSNKTSSINFEEAKQANSKTPRQ